MVHRKIKIEDGHVFNSMFRIMINKNAYQNEHNVVGCRSWSQTTLDRGQ